MEYLFKNTPMFQLSYLTAESINQQPFVSQRFAFFKEIK